MISEYFLSMPNSIKAVVLVVTLLTLIVMIYFLHIIRRDSSKASKRRHRHSNERHTVAVKKIEAEERAAGVTRHSRGLLAAASSLPPSSNDVIYEKNGIPYINSDLVKENKEILDGTFIKLVESVTGSPLTPPVPRQKNKPEKAHKGRKG